MPLPDKRVLELAIGRRIGDHREARVELARESCASAAAFVRAVTASTR